MTVITKPVLSLLLILLSNGALEEANPSSISGTIMESGTRVRVVGADVFWGPQGEHVVSDDNGRFSIQNVKPGLYSLRVLTEHGMGPSGSKVVQLQAGQQLTVDFDLVPNAAIAGRVLDQNGEPVPHFTVALVAREERANSLQPVYASIVTTNDLGQYVINNVKPGRAFLLFATPPLSIRESASAPADPALRKGVLSSAWYPDADSLDGAQTLGLNPGERKESIDIHIRQSNSFCADGILRNEFGPGPLSFYIEEEDAPISGQIGDSAQFIAPAYGKAQQDGKFRVCNLHVGRYRIFVAPMLGETEPKLYYGERELQIQDKDIHNFVVDGEPSVSLSVDLVWRGHNPSEASNVKISFTPIGRLPLNGEGRQLPARTNDSGQFVFSGLLKGAYIPRVVGLPKGSYVKDITFGGHSVLHQPIRIGSLLSSEIQIVLSSDAGSVLAKVSDLDGHPVPDCHIVLVPEGLPDEFSVADSLIVGQTDQHGFFSSDSIPPGKYAILAETFTFDRSPESIGRLIADAVGGLKLDLSEGGHAEVPLKISYK